MCANLFLNFGIDFDKAMAMKPSDVKLIFETNTFRDWKRSREAQGKNMSGALERLDNLIRAVGSLGKALVRSRL